MGDQQDVPDFRKVTENGSSRQSTLPREASSEEFRKIGFLAWVRCKKSAFMGGPAWHVYLVTPGEKKIPKCTCVPNGEEGRAY